MTPNPYQSPCSEVTQQVNPFKGKLYTSAWWLSFNMFCSVLNAHNSAWAAVKRGPTDWLFIILVISLILSYVASCFWFSKFLDTYLDWKMWKPEN